jgi:hypothetical protein
MLITGNKFKHICDYIFDERGFNETRIHNEIPIFFVKTDYVNTFFINHLPKYNFKLITHNSDFSIDSKFKKFIDNPLLIKWYGQNINFSHSKLESIPIGIANEIWEHGNENTIINELKIDVNKRDLLYCNFDINTNIKERSMCLKNVNQEGIENTNKVEFSKYLSSLHKSYFSISPNGNGIDCHKLWESLYLKTIPIVTDSINVRFYSHLPILILNSWEDFKKRDISINLYNNMMMSFDNAYLDINFYYEKILFDE